MHTVMPSRRAVLRAAIWTTPVIALAAAAPAYAASPLATPPVTVTQTTSGSGRKLNLVFTNTLLASSTITGIAVTVSGAVEPGTPTSMTLGVAGSATWNGQNGNTAPASGTGTALVSYTYLGNVYTLSVPLLAI